MSSDLPFSVGEAGVHDLGFAGATLPGDGSWVGVPAPAVPADDSGFSPATGHFASPASVGAGIGAGHRVEGVVSPMGRRRRAAAIVALFCVLATVAGVVGARFVKSPAQVAAGTAPPPLTRLTAPVQFGPLTATIVTRGAVLAGASVQAQPASALGAARLVVSAVLVRAGTAVHPGMVAAEVSGRPLIVLAGAVAAYRDLREGDRGGDVTQLQRALAGVGFPVGADAVGRFGRGTTRAVAGLYRSLGYAPAGGPKHAYLPMSEVVFVPLFPARVSQVDSRLGIVLKGPAVTISYGRLRLLVRIDPADAPLVRRGSPVTLTPDFGGRAIRAAVTSVGRPVLTSQGEQVQVRIRPARPLPGSWVGQDVQVTIISARTAGPVLYVPVSAISVSASGQASVTVARPGGATVVVPVAAGASANGFVAVRPEAGGRLAAGDRVVTGVSGR